MLMVVLWVFAVIGAGTVAAVLVARPWRNEDAPELPDAWTRMVPEVMLEEATQPPPDMEC